MFFEAGIHWGIQAVLTLVILLPLAFEYGDLGTRHSVGSSVSQCSTPVSLWAGSLPLVLGAEGWLCLFLLLLLFLILEVIH